MRRINCNMEHIIECSSGLNFGPAPLQSRKTTTKIENVNVVKIKIECSNLIQEV